jgi:tetratricopeptide (TPR) repeat protein
MLEEIEIEQDAIQEFKLPKGNAMMMSGCFERERDRASWLESGIELARKGCFEDAIDYLDAEIQREFLDCERLVCALHWSGVCYSGMKEFESAVRCYDRAVQLMPMNSEILFHRSRLVCKMKNFKDAIDGFTRVIRLEQISGKNSSLLGWSYFYRAETWFWISEHENALLDAKNALELLIEQKEEILELVGAIVLALSKERFQKHQYSEALSLLHDDEMFSSCRCHLKILFQKGSILRDLNDFQNAHFIYSKAHQVDPREPYALIYRAYCSYKLLNLESAIEDYYLSLEIDPANERAQIGLEKVFSLQHKLESSPKPKQDQSDNIIHEAA